MKASISRVDATEILKTVPPDQSFLFFEGIGKYTGRLAANLAEFCENIKTVHLDSVSFHFERGDYERWIRETLHDAELARRLKKMKKPGSGEELRNKILRVVRKRLGELQKTSRKKKHAPKRLKGKK